ncbi:hypothetical protein [Undibacterium flavidum]|nr:hypothetical protein [Undibacterium flavidum]
MSWFCGAELHALSVNATAHAISIDIEVSFGDMVDVGIMENEKNQHRE